MKRTVSINLDLPRDTKPPEVTGFLGTVAKVWEKMDGRISCSWLVPENAWPCLKPLRAHLRSTAASIEGAELNEWCNAMLEPGDRKAANLVALAIPSVINRPFVHDEPVVMTSCGCCGGRMYVLQDELALRVRKGPPLPVMSLGRHWLLAVSPTVRRALGEAGLAGNVRFLPVDVTRGEPCWMVVPETLEPVPAAPYGWAGNPCPECRRGVARFSFFPVFQRGDSPPCWFGRSSSELLSPIVEKRVFGLLSSFAAGAEKPAQLMGMVYGWADADSDAAFLPEEFQD